MGGVCPLSSGLLGEEVDMEGSSDDEEASVVLGRFNPGNRPMDLLRRLVKVMSYKKKKHQPDWYLDGKSIAQEVVGQLWSVGKDSLPVLRS